MNGTGEKKSGHELHSRVLGDRRVGPYEILAHLGSGGMGEVYHARDPRLGRDVAVKLLSAELLNDADRLRRSRQEARTAAAVGHPNVLAVHDVGITAEGPYIVTELLRGESLADRLERGPLSTRQAIRLTAAAARGLGAVHARGVVHRDLKPSNIFITRDGQVKLLDFGLARLVQRDEERIGGGAATPSGTVLGTPHYMSPEQARGEAPDARSDIFALGAILYELLCGERAFSGPSAAETMTSIIRDEPPRLDELLDRIPPALGEVLRHCLEKNPEERFQSARDLAFHLESILATAATPARRRLAGRRAPPRPWLAALAAAALVSVALTVWWWRRPAEQPARLRTVTFSGSDTTPAAALDGHRIAYTSARDGASRIWLKDLSQGQEVPLTAGPDSAPRFSPSGTQLLFVREEPGGGTLYRVSSVGGEPRRLLEDVYEADWSPDGRRVAFLRRVNGARGPASILGVAAVDADRERKLADLATPFYAFPRWSPDGRWIALGHGGPGIPGAVLLVASEGGTSRFLDTGLDGRVHGLAWNGDGSLIVAQAEVLSAGQRTTPGRICRCTLGGDCTTLLNVSRLGMGLDVLADGVLVFGTEAISQRLLEMPLDGQGTPERWLTRGSANDRQPVYSPDGEWIAFSSERSGTLDVWVVSRTTGALRRLTDSPGEDWDPAWTADGRSLLFSSNRSGHFEIWKVAADGSSAQRITRAARNFQNPTTTPDGEWITFVVFDGEPRGLWKVRAEGRQPIRLVTGALLHPEISPDGRYVLFHRRLPDDTEQIQIVRLADGRPVPFEIRIPAFPGAGRGRWLPDGSGVAFVGRDADGRTGVFVQEFEPGRNTDATRRPVGGFREGMLTESFGIAPDGRFLTIALRDPQASLTVARNVEGVAAADELNRRAE